MLYLKYYYNLFDDQIFLSTYFKSKGKNSNIGNNARSAIIGFKPILWPSKKCFLENYVQPFWQTFFYGLRAAEKSFIRKSYRCLGCLETCIREGSLDSAIEQEVPNDFDSFLKTHPNIKHLFFNGQKAAAYFKQYIKLDKDYSLTTLPSTSPANAVKSFESKLSDWSVIKIR